MICRSENVVEVLSTHGDFPDVHVLEEAGHLLGRHVLQEDDGVLARVLDEQLPEVRRAGGQDQLVGLEALILSCYGDVSENFILYEERFFLFHFSSM